VIGAVIIKHKLSISDEETVEQIRENPYLQYFIGLKGFQAKAPFASSLLVEIRKRMGQTVFDEFHESIIETVEPRRTKKSVKASDDDNDDDVSNSGEVGSSGAATAMEAEQSLADEQPRNHGKLILDATVAEQAIRYPTDLGLLNEARELSERIIDELHAKSNRAQRKKPRTYREIARKAYLSLVKLRRPSNRKRRAGIRQQLQFLQRNLNHIEAMLTEYPLGTPIPLPNGLLRRYWVLPHLYQQHYAMYKTNTRRCDDRIVSISQPYLRPIIRGKQGKAVEFGAKISVSLTDKGLAHVDKLHWDAQHEGHDLEAQVEAYKKRYGYYPDTYARCNTRNTIRREALLFMTIPASRRNSIYDCRHHILIAMCGAVLLLILFIRIRDTGKELRLDQHRSKAMGFADLLVYAAVVEDGVIVGKNGSLMAAWVFCGDDTASSTEIERERVSFRINQALSRLGNGWMIHVDAIRKPALGYSDKAHSNYPDPVTAAIDRGAAQSVRAYRHNVRELLYRITDILTADAGTAQVHRTDV
jgi:hypothetical protein